jgi:glycosyltransferase involved in cell wall biosynthesis
MTTDPGLDLISFVIPTYNASSYIAQTLESIANQRYEAYEIIITDDGSTDKTIELIAQTPKLRILTQNNCGPSSARNRGFMESQGKLIWFLDSDDILAPNAVHGAVRYMKDNPGCHAVVGQWCFIDSIGNRTSPTIKPTEDLFESQDSAVNAMLLRTLFPVGSMLTRRDCIETCGGWDETLRCAEDRDLWLRMILAGFSFQKLDLELFCYRLHETNTTLDITRVQTYIDQFTNKWFKGNVLSDSRKEKLLRYANCLNYLFLAQKCIEQKTQPHHHLTFVNQAKQQIADAPVDNKLLSEILWESSGKPWEEEVRKQVWMKEPDTVSAFNWIQFRCLLSQKNWRVAMRYFAEILTLNPLFFLRKLVNLA